VGDRTKVTYLKLFKRIDDKYTVNYLCTDGLDVYKRYRFESNNGNKYIPKNVYITHKVKEIKDKKTGAMRTKYIKCKDVYSNQNRKDLYSREETQQFSKHIANKKETCLIESINSSIRNYLARFTRKTKRYSKSIEMLMLSLYLLFDKLFWKTSNLWT
jgi:IS1 family transposase